MLWFWQGLDQIHFRWHKVNIVNIKEIICCIVITISGFLGEVGNTVSGEIYPSRDDQQWVAFLYLTGSYPEDDGITTVDNLKQDVTDSNRIVGSEL